jgi:protein-S-isoprenylcysteine O-methyltransferase Ste14
VEIFSSLGLSSCFMEPQTATLGVAFAIATHLIRRCTESPHEPETKHDQDRLFSVPIVKDHGPKLVQFAFLAPCIYHIILTAFSPTEESAICPKFGQVNPKYFTWSTYTILCLVIIFISATLRLWAFRTLGKNFTYQLAKPDRLVTTGIYAYVQHASYGPFFVLLCATLMMFLPFDAGAACFLPREIVQMWSSWRWLILALAMAVIGGGISVRVRDEEAMLKETFGKQWVDWHTKTPRFVPFLF